MLTTLQNRNKKNAKKGFTLTELAIVIAVIAILVAVLVPTFTSIINKAHGSNAVQTAKNAITSYTIQEETALEDGSVIVVVENKTNYYYISISGAPCEVTADEADDNIDTTYANTITKIKTAISSGNDIDLSSVSLTINSVTYKYETLVWDADNATYNDIVNI